MPRQCFPAAKCAVLILHRYAIGKLDKATGRMQTMDAEAGRIIRMEPRCFDVDYEDTGAGVRSEPLDVETRMKEYKRCVIPTLHGAFVWKGHTCPALQSDTLNHTLAGVDKCSDNGIQPS